MNSFDLIIIGGGINGAGIAREAAERGLKVALLEKGDFGEATTAASTRLIHGGLRYLEHGELTLVRESLKERATLLKLAPHLVRLIPLVIPIFKDRRFPGWKVGIGLTMYDYFSLGDAAPWHRRLSVQELLRIEPFLRKESLVSGFAYYDGQASFPERLALENILTSQQYGAVARNYCKVEGFIESSGIIQGVRGVDVQTGKPFEVFGNCVINATGAWVDQTNRLLRKPVQPLMGGTKGSHLVVKNNNLKLRCAVYSPAKQDGRPFFVIPWQHYVLVGTTDLRTDEELDTMRASNQEVDYLLKEVNLLFNVNLTKEDILYTYCGVRPLPQSKKAEGAVTRKHFIVDHANHLVSIVGGKLTTYRHLAEQAVDKLAQKGLVQGVMPSKTHLTPLWGSSFGGKLVDWKKAEKEWPEKLSREYGLEAEQVKYLMQLYGARVEEVLQPVKKDRSLCGRILPDQPDIAVQALWGVKQEMVRHLEDFMLRRTGLGLKGCRDIESSRRVAGVLGRFLSWDEARQQQEAQSYVQILELKHQVPQSV